MKTIGKGMCWVIQYWSNEQMITRCFDQGVDADSQNKNNVSQNCLVHRRDSYARQSVPETIRETAVPRTAECEKGAADRADYRSRWSDCQTDSRCSKAAVALCVPKRNFGTEEKSSGIGGRKSCWRKCISTGARVSAEPHDENKWDAHDVWEFRR